MSLLAINSDGMKRFTYAARVALIKRYARPEVPMSRVIDVVLSAEVTVF